LLANEKIMTKESEVKDCQKWHLVIDGQSLNWLAVSG